MKALCRVVITNCLEEVPVGGERILSGSRHVFMVDVEGVVVELRQS